MGDSRKTLLHAMMAALPSVRAAWHKSVGMHGSPAQVAASLGVLDPLSLSEQLGVDMMAPPMGAKSGKHGINLEAEIKEDVAQRCSATSPSSRLYQRGSRMGPAKI